MGFTVYTCPKSFEDAKQDAVEAEIRLRLEKLLSRCKDILSKNGLEYDSLFTSDYHKGVGFSFEVVDMELAAIEGNPNSDKVLSETMSELEDLSGFRSYGKSVPSLPDIARRMADACLVDKKMIAKAERVASKSMLSRVKAPAPLERNKDLHARLLNGSGALQMQGPKSVHQIDELFSRVHEAAPWLRGATTRIWNATKARFLAADGAEFTLPPVLLHGPPGTGKTHLAHLIAKYSGTMTTEIDASAGAAAFRISGVESGWASCQIGEPLRVISESRTPNPIVVVNEIDKAFAGIRSTAGSGTSLPNALLPFLDRNSARSFHCPATGLVCDMSAVSWILTANNLDHVSAPLRTRFDIIEVPALTFDDYIEAAEVMVSDDEQALQVICRMIALRHGLKGFSLRDLARMVERLVVTPKFHLYH